MTRRLLSIAFPFIDAEGLSASTEAVTENTVLQIDEDTFRGFYDRTATMVWAYLARATGDPHAADDLLQDTYYRFLRARVTFDSEAHRRHYLFRIATNLCAIASDGRNSISRRYRRIFPRRDPEISRRRRSSICTGRWQS